MNSLVNKRKIINDPVYGFITLPHEIIYDLIEHPFFQRLRRIRQLGLTTMVYPGAYHTRFHHALGAMHLATEAIATLKTKGIQITDEEARGVTIAILLHDIGHGPFSHALENSIVKGTGHETLSLMIMEQLNEQFTGQLTLGISIFKDEYPKKFLHQLISSQLDVDRLDYLTRDSFYTGVSEGVVGVERIIKMLNVKDDNIVVEAKGIYSIEKFLIARHIMYWQVYLHKTVISAEFLLIKALKRAKELAGKGVQLFCTPTLQKFLYNDFSTADFVKEPSLLKDFSSLDDYDILTSIKVWQQHDDFILSKLCSALINRKLYKVELQVEEFDTAYLEKVKKEVKEKFAIDSNDLDYFVFSDSVENRIYNKDKSPILLQYKDGSTKEISETFDLFNVANLVKPVKKHFLCQLR
ncbi:MAG: HD domain-containing protein [Bacteroidetes bacterium]|nr:HD domain-containing protein [Bacteroidota bacterium]